MANFTDRIAVLVTADTGGAVQPLNALQREATRTDAAFDRLGKRIGVTGATIKSGLVAGAAALVSTGLVAFLNQSVSKYAEAAKSANDLALATGGTADEVSRMTAALEDSGVSAEQTAGLLTKFTVSAGKNTEAMKALNVEFVRGKSGAVDYAATMVRIVDAIGEVADANQRNALYVQFFGRQGAAAFRDLAASGIDLADAMAAISKYRIFDAEDVRRALAYDDAVDGLKASLQGLQFSLGAALVPLMTQLAEAATIALDALNPLLQIVANIPPELYIMAAAGYAVSKAFTALNTTLAVSAGVSMAMAEGLTFFQAVRVSLTGIGNYLVEALAPMAPLAAGLAVVTLAIVSNQIAVANTDKAVREYVDGLSALERQALGTAKGLDATATSMEKQANFFENLDAAKAGSNWAWVYNSYSSLKTFYDAIRSGGGDLEEYKNRLEDLREEAGDFAVAQAEATSGVKDLTDAITRFLTPGSNQAGILASIGTLASDANDALFEQARITDAAATAMGEYAVSVQQAVKYQDELVGRKLGVQDALEGLTASVKALKDENTGAWVTDDPATFQHEWEQAALGVEDSVWEVIQAMAEVGLSGDKIRQKFADMGLLDNLPADVRKRVEEALVEIDGLPSERVMDFMIRPSIDWSQWSYGGADPNGTGRFDPTGLKAEIDRLSTESIEVPISQNVTVKVDKASLDTATDTIKSTFEQPIQTNPVLEIDAAQINADLQNAVGQVDVAVVPDLDERQAGRERGTLEDAFNNDPVEAPVIADVYDSQAKKDLDALSKNRTMTITVKYVTPSGQTVQGLTGATQAYGAPGTQSAPVPVSTQYSTNYTLKDVHIEASDPMALYSGVNAIAARKRMAGAGV